ncbi:protein sidekick-1-like isoform X2 [Oscarella lobularis]|uniref:protein sidekick-1-like isoform X2 n=1 Tax=Oscarella lobularis TaxID=121494 RepID=UPI003313E2EB
MLGFRFTAYCIAALVIVVIESSAVTLQLIGFGSVTIGHQAEMSCTVNSSLRIVEWRKDLTLIPLSNSPGSHYQFNAEKSSLVIAQLLAADKGLYQCIAETASNHRIPSNSVLLDVLVKPTIFPMGAVVREGSSARLGCPGHDFTHVYWSKDGRDIFHKTGYRHNGSSHEYLDILQASPADAGKYNCTAINNYLILGRSAFPTLVVEYAPVIVQGPRGKTVVKGYEVHLFCNVTGVPPPRIYWKKDGAFVKTLGKRFEVGYAEGTLFIETAELSDAGLYSCFANNSVNSLGKESKAVKLNIIGVQKFYAGEDAYKTVLYGANETIWCTSNHSISNRVIWYKGGKELETTNQLVAGSSGQLLIFQATYNISGVYECNFEGQLLPPGIKLFQKVFITIRGPPSAPELLSVSLKLINESVAIAHLNWTIPFDGNSPITGFTISVGQGRNNLIRKHVVNHLASAVSLVLDVLKFGVPTFFWLFYVFAHNVHGNSSQSNVLIREFKRATNLPTFVSQATIRPKEAASTPVHAINSTKGIFTTSRAIIITESAVVSDVYVQVTVPLVSIIIVLTAIFIFRRRSKRPRRLCPITVEGWKQYRETEWQRTERL